MRGKLDYFQLLAESRRPTQSDCKRLRIALLADCATQQLAQLLRALFSHRKMAAEIYEGPFAAIELEVRNPYSGLYEFQPDAVVILNSVQHLRDTFYERAEDEDFGARALREIASVWDLVRRHSRATLIQSTFVSPAESFFGNFELKADESLGSIVSTLNSALVSQSRSRSSVLLVDLERIASWVGRNAWFDERLWTIGKYLCSLEHLPLVGQHIVDVISATQGQHIKCVVTDLDNTLWGGVIGDDGVHGIKIAAHGDGEPHYRLQCFLKELERRGVLLAVCSKNDYHNAMAPFTDREDMVLKSDDFAVFVANWNNKPENILTIQKQLNIGLDSILFLDDSAFERANVRAVLPEVIVPELSDDPSDWIKELSATNSFEVASYTEEDKNRADQYRQEAQRRISAEGASSFEEFLVSLEMQIELNRFAPERIPRIVQLLQRSNQFNLTTRRHTAAECEGMMQNTRGYLPLYAELHDRFGNHGLISIVILNLEHGIGTISITDWLMSCRVLGRGVEEYLMNYVVDYARHAGAHQIIAKYTPTTKNAMVKDFYGRFGFNKVHEEPNGTISWMLSMSEYQRREVFINPTLATSYTAG